MRLMILLLAWLILPGLAHAEVTATVIATDPPGATVTLGKGQSFYVRIRYNADRPVSIWARPFFHGREVGATTNASVPHEGSGEALGWFEFIDPGEVDEIRILVNKPGTRFGQAISIYPVEITGTDAPAAGYAHAAWVDQLLQAQKAVEWQEYEARMKQPVTTSDRVFMSGFMGVVLLLMLSGFALPAWALWKWSGGWRLAAAVPVAIMGFVVLRFLLDTALDPTSHNLWPFEMIMYGMLCVGIIGVLTLMRRLMREPR
ncbi:MAG: hypothetical protein ACRETM_00475 [Stenotrophobium sp.]